MCEKCDDIDKDIARYRWIKTQISDSRTQKAIDDIIEKLEAEKRSLHPEK